jgi:hemoglobin
MAPIFPFKWGSDVTKPSVLSCALCALLVLGTAHAGPKTLFESMGGEAVLRSAVDRFTDIAVADDRINFTFAEADLSKFKQLLYDQLCNLSGGPCIYTGRDMRTAHAKLGINTAEFNALAEDLYIALAKSGVPYRQQNRLMALLAPMKRDIVKSQKAAEEAAFPDSSAPSSSAPRQ